MSDAPALPRIKGETERLSERDERSLGSVRLIEQTVTANYAAAERDWVILELTLGDDSSAGPATWLALG